MARRSGANPALAYMEPQQAAFSGLLAGAHPLPPGTFPAAAGLAPPASPARVAPSPVAPAPVAASITARAAASCAGTKLLVPQGSVKRIVKLDPDVKFVSREATFVLAKATEHFVAELALRALQQQTAEGITYAAVSSVLSAFEFEEGVAPPRPVVVRDDEAAA